MAQNITPNAHAASHRRRSSREERARIAGSRSRTPRRSSAAWRGQFGISFDDSRPRVVMSFPQNPNDMLLSGTLASGQLLSNRAAVVDVPLGKGHVVMFAIRPFWRWQTQGTYFLGFNAILNWNDLDAGKSTERPHDYRRATAA